MDNNRCLSAAQSQSIEALLKQVLRNKFERYAPESIAMPFHTRLLGRDRMALFSFIHSMNTNFGTTIFEPVAKALALTRFQSAQNHVEPDKVISSDAQLEIQHIIDNLRAANCAPCKPDEIEAIRNKCRSGSPRIVKLTNIDLRLEARNGALYLFDIKAAKPNKGEFMGYKRTLLEWVAAVLYQNPNRDIHTLLAIPYNPYEPKPYSRWTMRGMIDLDHELMVGHEFWDFLAGEGAYGDILDCFERVGIALRDEIDRYFARF